MGTKMAPAYANLFMNDFEESFLNTQERKPTVWVRYIDDIFIIWEHGQSHLDMFMSAINHHSKAIKFTIEQSNEAVPFLDTTVFIKENRICTRLYTKPTDSHLYLRFDSCHPPHCKTAIPKSQYQRLYRLHSEKEEYPAAAKLLTQHLTNRRYPTKLTVPLEENPPPVLTARETKEQRLTFITEYNPQLPKITTILLKHKHILEDNEETHFLTATNPLVCYRRPRSIRDQLVRSNLTKQEPTPNGSGPCGHQCKNCKHMTPTTSFTSTVTKQTYKVKGTMNCDSKNLIYMITCKKCMIQYIGQTGNTLKTRFNGHRHDITSRKDKQVSNHFNSQDHRMDDVMITAIMTSSDDVNTRLRHEDAWIRIIRTHRPSGLNIQE
jgi:hypothetical protein